MNKNFMTFFQLHSALDPEGQEVTTQHVLSKPLQPQQLDCLDEKTLLSFTVLDQEQTHPTRQQN